MKYIVATDLCVAPPTGSLPSGIQLLKSGECSLFTTNLPLDQFARQFAPGSIDFHSKFMDHFFVVLANSTLRQDATDLIFSFAAGHYSEHADLQINIANIEAQGSILIGSSKRPRPILIDFGCGPGTSMKTSLRESSRLVGYDRVPAMRFEAMLNGLPTLHERDVALLPPFADGLFASFVMHLLPDLDEFMSVARLVSPGGMLIANFYKSWNLDSFSKDLFQRGWECSEPAINSPRSSGPSRIFRRIER